MGTIMGMGSSHWPAMIQPDEAKPWPFLRTLANDPRVPAELKNPLNWPEGVRAEWGQDEGVSAHREHRRRLVEAFRELRKEIQAFAPDFILMFGDDQYENFTEDIIPPFCVMAFADLTSHPFKGGRRGRSNVWNEPEDHAITMRSKPDVAKWLASRCLEERRAINGAGQEPDPISPTPRRCFEVGRIMARILADSPWRVVMYASGGWSHGFLVEKHHCLWPDVESDRLRAQQIRDGREAEWKELTVAKIEDAGQQELMTWICVAGAMHELGQKGDVIDYVETAGVFNSGKCLAVWKP